MGCGSSKQATSDNETPARPTNAGVTGGMGSGTGMAAGTGVGASGGAMNAQKQGNNMEMKKQDDPANPIVYFDMAQAGRNLGRIEMVLFQDVVPATSENFRRFCTGEFRDSSGRVQGYKGSTFHRVIKNFMCQGGDFISGDGTGTMSIYNPDGFQDENFQYQHKEPGTLSMANSGPDSNGCQFFLTTVPTPHLDGKHVVFGRVIKGMDVVTKIENTRVDKGDRPLQDVVVQDCGQLNKAGVPDA